MPYFLNMMGIAGIEKGSSRLAKLVEVLHQWTMIIIALGLMLEPYILAHNTMSDYLFLKLSWMVWGLFTLESLLLVLLVKRHWHYLLFNWLNIAIVFIVFPLCWIQLSHMGWATFLRPIVIVYLLLPLIRASFKSLSPTQFLQTLVLLMVLTVLAGLFINYIDPAIGSPWRGIWWAFQTITTVGYGNILPKTFSGQLFSIFFMMVGIGLVATLSASFAYYMLKRKGLDQAHEAQQALKAELDEIKGMLHEIRKDQG